MTYVVQTPTTTVAVSSPTTSVEVGAAGFKGDTGPGLPIAYFLSGEASPRTGHARYRFPFAAIVTGVSAAVDTAPAGAGIVFDVNVNGASILNTPLTVPEGSDELATVPLNVPVTAGDYMTVDIDSVGTVTPGSNLTILIQYTS